MVSTSRVTTAITVAAARSVAGSASSHANITNTAALPRPCRSRTAQRFSSVALQSRSRLSAFVEVGWMNEFLGGAWCEPRTQSAYQHPLGLQGKAGVGDSYIRKSETRSGSPCSILIDNAHGRM